ncbi:MAG: ABC transporter substrate-binding protein [Pirellulaceae bacterium]
MTDSPSQLSSRKAPVIASMLAVSLLVAGGLTRGWAQEAKPKSGKAKQEKKVEPPLLEQEPFDLITLDAANENQQLKVVPLLGGARKSPFNVDLGGKYRIRLIELDDREFEILGSHIAKVELYEELLLKEARRLFGDGKFDEAFDYFYTLRFNYPELPHLDDAINDYLYLDAVQLTRVKRYSQALGLVEELLSRSASYRYSAAAPAMVDFLSGLLDRMLNAYVEEENYRAARILLQRIQERYPTNKPEAVDQWVRQLETMARQRRDQAREHLDARRFREAITLVKQMVDIWPDVQGGRALDEEISARYPLILVGVVQPAQTNDAQRLDNWPARRTGRLVNRSLVEFLGPGPEGGQYEFPWGLIERSEDRMRMIFRLNRLVDDDSAITGYELSARLLELADPSALDYSPAWSALVEGATVVDVMQVDVDLRRPHVLPEAMLRVPVASVAIEVGEAEQPPAGNGPFAVAFKTEEEVRFATKGFVPGDRLAEIVEITYDDANKALGALRRGDIDALDRLFPADALRLQENITSGMPIEVDSYALPTVHMLIPKPEKNSFLAHRDFRRAITFAINREAILNQELLGGREVYGCRVISGPFPAGAGDRDPLGYAYNAEIRPRRYDPRLAKLLTIVAQKQVAEMAQKRGEPEPKLEPLVLGHPSHETARVACQAIAAQLKVIGLETVLREFTPGITRDVQDSCDLVYTEIAIWEPVVDSRRLLGPGGPAASDSPYVRQAIRWLEEAQNWGDVRERLLQLHTAAHNEAVIIPLWQLVDFFAYNKRLRNVGENPVWLYQNIDQWRLSSAAPK